MATAASLATGEGQWELGLVYARRAQQPEKQVGAQRGRWTAGWTAGGLSAASIQEKALWGEHWQP